MITQLPALQMPAWLETILNGNVDMQLPLKDILKDSLYYPASGLNGTPVKYLAGNVWSFIYADYAIDREEFLNNLNGTDHDCGFMGYQSIVQRELYWHDIVPSGWTPPIVPMTKEERPGVDHKEIRGNPFGHWSIWRRNPELDSTTGPIAFSFVFFSGEMSAIYQALYCRLSMVPMIMAIIQQGWTNKPFFQKVVASNKAGLPEYLLYGGFGRGFYDAPCWDEYDGERLVQLPERYAGLWKLNTTNNTTH